MKFCVAIALFLGLVVVSQALPSKLGRQEEVIADPSITNPLTTAAPLIDDAAAAIPDATAAGAQKHHALYETKPEVRPHPLNWHAIYTAIKAVAPVVGGLIEPLLVNIAHGIVGAVIETINTGFSIPVPHPIPAHQFPHETSSDHHE